MRKIDFLFMFFLITSILFFFRAFIFSNKLPFPADTIVGLYHPFRDLYAKAYPRGIPFKNFLITDPARQQYPWRFLVIDMQKKIELPLWNPYTMAGVPLLANHQSAPFYPLNIVFLPLPFEYAWSILVMLQPILGALFLYLYLVYMRLNRIASLLGSITFAFSGFSIAWMQWNTIGHTVLWLPLILLAKEHLLKKLSLKWIILFILAETSSIFAGHLQTLFYIWIIGNTYLLTRMYQILGKETSKSVVSIVKIYKPFLVLAIVVAAVTSVQWIPLMQFIQLSARAIDQHNWQQAGWFIPWQHLVQFIIPDFFGNPATLNYWGVWNYAEFIGYVGIAPFLMAIFALVFRHDRKTIFFGTLFFLSLIFSLPTVFAKLPYLFNIPLLSTAQPTRLVFIVDFSLAILAALGFDYLIKNPGVRKKMIYILGSLGIIYVGIWSFVLLGEYLKIPTDNLLVTKRNVIFPTILMTGSAVLFVSLWIFQRKRTITLIIYSIIIAVTVLDLLRFAEKFTPFTNKEYLFPSAKTIEFLQKNIGNFRVMTTDSRILPPNFSIIYKIQSVDGYDPLYLLNYGELIAASERGKPDISVPFGFNRIITPHNFDSKIIDLLGVKYVLSLEDLSSPKLEKVFQEGQTRIYENKNVFPRTMIVSIHPVLNKQEEIDTMFAENVDLKKIATIEDKDFPYSANDPPYMLFKKPQIPVIGKATIVSYKENKILIHTESTGDAWLILTDNYYPIWNVTVDGKRTKLYRVNYTFRGVRIPSKGKHTVEFYNTLL